MNRRILYIGMSLCVAVVLLYDTTWASEWKRVTWVDDGDTVVLSDGVRVRYIGVNAPEVAHEGRPAERFGPEARAFNGKLVFQKKVRLELDREEQDQYNRLLAYVFLEDGTFVNAELVRGGYAYCLFQRPNTKYDGQLLGLQKEAMKKRAGLWQGFVDQEGPYVGNRHSKRFHGASCPFGKKISPKNRIFLKTRHDAFWKGFSPCKRCKP
ncbi:MAG: thermonuclease family protein [Thermodesulfobacteriota bacterium]|nr:thermonuclease family protein [Thermodesulfobacteriota bacterium]